MTNSPTEYGAQPVTGSGAPGYPDRDGTTTPETAAWPPVEPSSITTPSTTPTTSTPSSTKDVAKDEASKVKDTAVDAGKEVAATAKDEAANVVGETKQQAKSLFGSVTSELQTQVGSQQQRVATSVHALSKELGGMASKSEESGPLTDLAHQAAAKGGEIAHWLENHEPRDVLREVQSFGRRRPVMFLALCGAAGVLAGRLTRGAVAANTEIDSPSAGKSDFETPRRALDATPEYQTAPPSMVDELPTSYENSYATDVTRTTDPAYAPTPGYGAADPVNPINPTERPGGVR